MKAIETIWKGYRFRSRTEARWAVFLEKLGIVFDYEPEGVILPSGPYLPDFRLRAFPIGMFPGGYADEHVWLEVKGQEPTDLEIQKCRELSAAAKVPVLLAVGAPEFGFQIMLFDDIEEDNPAREMITHLVGWLSFIDVGEGKDAAIAVGRPARQEEPEPSETLEGEADEVFQKMWAMFDGPFARVLGVEGARFVSNDKIEFRLSERLKAAYDASRSARFEFGQTDPRWPS